MLPKKRTPHPILAKYISTKAAVIGEGWDLKALELGPTHVNILKGQAHVPDKDLAGFYALLARDCERLVLGGWCELAGPSFRQFCDCDFCFEKPISSVQQEMMLAEMLHGAMIATGNAHPVLVFTSVHTPKDECGYGMHLIWDFAVDRDEARSNREAMVVELSRVQPEFDWDKIIDSGVYGERNAGLRMPGSFKAKNCEHCDPETQKACWQCGGMGVVPVLRSYRFLCALDAKGKYDEKRSNELAHDLVEQMTQASIRLPQTRKRSRQDGDSKGVKRARHDKLVSLRTPNASEGLCRMGSGLCKEVNDVVIASGNWSKIAVSSIKLGNKSDILFVSVVGADSLKCMIKLKAEGVEYHSRSTIYFVIKDYFLYQRCYCKRCKHDHGYEVALLHEQARNMVKDLIKPKFSLYFLGMVKV